MSFHRPSIVAFVSLLISVAVALYGLLPSSGSPAEAFRYLTTAIFLGLLWVVKRGISEKANLPKVGLETLLLAFMLTNLTSIFFSPGPRIGLERLSWLVLLYIIFYLMLDLLEHQDNRSNIREILLIVTIPILFHALLETYARYLIWWEQSGSQNSAAPFTMRFTSLVGHANTFLALMNLVAPVAVVTFLLTKKRTIRVLCAFWLVLYAITVPFSSSRGGWLGTASWVGALVLWWLSDNSRWKIYLNYLKLRPLLTVTVGPILLLTILAGSFMFYQQFAASHPTHGSSSILNREFIWASAIKVWQSSPLIGSGLGRFGLDILPIARVYPSEFWPMTAHSTLLQVLGETGLIGFLSFVALSVVTITLFLNAYLKVPIAERPWIIASISALFSTFIHGFFEDFTTKPFILLVVVIHAALILAAAGPVPRFKRLSLAWLAVPGIAVMAVGIFNLWSRAPLYDHATINFDFPSTNWQAASKAAEETYRRDPLMPFFSAEAGLAYAMAWQQTVDPQDLERARQYLIQTAALEPQSSMLWADLAVLNWYSGRSDEALEAIQKAVALCPKEPSFYVNYGWFLENSGQHAQAEAQYQLALALDPRMANHPFWSGSADRIRAVESFAPDEPLRSYHWETAMALLDAGDTMQAQYELAVSNQYQEPLTARTSAWVTFETEKGGKTEAEPDYDSLVSAVDADYWGMLVGGGLYSWYFARSGFPMSVVPGYIRVTEDAGQFDHLRTLVDMQIADGQCEEAAYTWQVLQRELHAGVLPEGGYAAMPACKYIQ